jgi:hypothetical protein
LIIVKKLAGRVSELCTKQSYEHDIMVLPGLAGDYIRLFRFLQIHLTGAVGIILPWWLRVIPVLTPVTAVGFALLMVFAAPIHYKRKEPKNLAINMIIMVISIFTVYGRFAGLA